MVETHNNKKPGKVTRAKVEAKQSADWLAGGGEMGRLVRSIDWSKTALGPLGSWPQSLRTTVSTCLSSRFPILIWWGPEFVKIYNDAYRPMLGNKHPRSMGQRGAECWPEIWPVIGPMLKAVVSTGEATWSENQLLMLDRNGFLEECYFTFSYSPIRDESGGIGGVFCAVTETTAQVLSERRLHTLRALAQRTAEAKTAEQACSLAALALEENAADLPFTLIYLADAEARRGQQAAAVGVSGLETLVGAPQKNAEPGSWPLEEVLRTGQAMGVTGDAVTRGLGTLRSRNAAPSKSALLIPVSLTGEARPSGVLVVGLSPFLAVEEQYRNFLDLVAGQIATSIASARTLEAAELRAQALADIDRAKTTFFSNVSHEFRTPLTLMLGPTEDALASKDGTLRGADLETVHRNELRLLKLVNTLLDFSRIEAGRAEVKFELTDIASLTRDIATAFRATIERGGLRFEVRCEAVAEQVYVDRDMWEKIVLNLLSNAFKFTFEGGIVVELRCREHCVKLEVRDSGGGIASADLPRLFERFHRILGTRSRSYEGTGIGLALVRDLVRLHGGDISVASHEGEGTSFIVSIPTGVAHLSADRVRALNGHRPAMAHVDSFVAEAMRWVPQPEDDHRSSALATAVHAPQPTATPPTLGMRIIVADDNADMREYLVRLLSEHWQVEAVADGEQALALAQRAVPSLVLTDVMMPNLDGFGLLRALREDSRTASVPVVMLSARAGEVSRVEGLAAGADDYLIKPFSAKELIARVALHLELGHLRRAADLERYRLYSLFDQAPAAIAVLRGPDFIFELTNARYDEIVQRQNLTGKRLVEALPELEGQPIQDILRRVYTTGERFVGHEFLIQLVRDSGARTEDVYFDFVYEPFREVDGVVAGIMVVALDVSERVRGARERERLLAEREGLHAEREQLLLSEREARRGAEAASRAKDEFLAMLGHELRNPLAPIVTALHLLRMRLSNTAERELTIIERQVRHLTTLVDDLLDISRITKGKIELKRERIELGAVVARAVEIASPLLEQRRHNLVVEVPQQGLLVDADPTRLAQIISNLLNNAAKYTEVGGRIVIAAARTNGHVNLSVVDSGIGIAEQMLPYVFDLFMQERQAIDRASGGLGIGLAIVRSLVEMHGGTVSAMSNGRGTGSTFTIRLPAATTLGPPRPEAAPPPPPQATAKVGRRVLVVDDNGDAAEMLAFVLNRFECETRIAPDGPAALALLESFKPELALVDIGLPVMDGYELARHLRARPDGAKMRLVAITGYGQKSDVDRALAAGFDEHFVKPVEIQKLRALLAKLLAATVPS